MLEREREKRKKRIWVEGRKDIRVESLQWGLDGKKMPVKTRWLTNKGIKGHGERKKKN